MGRWGWGGRGSGEGGEGPGVCIYQELFGLRRQERRDVLRTCRRHVLRRNANHEDYECVNGLNSKCTL